MKPYATVEGYGQEQLNTIPTLLAWRAWLIPNNINSSGVFPQWHGTSSKLFGNGICLRVEGNTIHVTEVWLFLDQSSMHGEICSRTGRECWFQLHGTMGGVALESRSIHYGTSTTVTDRDGLFDVHLSAQCGALTELDLLEWMDLLPWV